MRTTPLAAAALVATSALILVLGFAAPANATSTLVGDGPTLVSAFSNSAIDEVGLGADATVTDLNLIVSHDLTLDLAGWSLTTRNITIYSPFTLTIIDTSVAKTGALHATASAGLGDAGITVSGALTIGTSLYYGGTIDATGDCSGGAVYCGAGIGSNYFGIVGTITINQGDVSGYGGGQASSLEGGAGIGGGYNSQSAGHIVINGGTVYADGGSSSAGIGGANQAGAGADVTITGGNVTALGGEYSAGIGGSMEAFGGVIDIEGGTIDATGGTYASGIGGGGGSFGSSGGTITINNATVTATGSVNGAGIGGGWGGVSNRQNYGTDLSIGAGSTVTASGIRAVGPASAGSTTIVGSLSIAGNLIVPTGGNLDIPTLSTATVVAGGLISGDGSVEGAGTIDNHGTITNAAVTTATVTDHNYAVDFVGNSPAALPQSQVVRVYATSLAAGVRSIPGTPINPAAAFIDWNLSADGSGSAFTTATALSADTSVYGKWANIHLVITPSTTTRVAGQSATFTVEGFSATNVSLGDRTGQATFTTNHTSGDTVTGNSILFGPAGTTTVTAALTSDPSISATTPITVTADVAHPVSITLNPSGSGSTTPSVDQGGSLTFVATGTDAYGNTFDVTSQMVLTSDVATDVVAGATVTFPHASPHVITATLGSVTGSVTVAVIPAAAVILAVTGAILSVAVPVYALLAVIAGLVLLFGARRRRRLG